MVTLEEISLIFLGAFLGAFLALFVSIAKDIISEHLSVKKMKKSLLFEFRTNTQTVNRLHNLTFSFTNIVLIQIITSGIINKFDDNLKERLIVLNGDIHVYNEKLHEPIVEKKQIGLVESLKTDIRRAMENIMVSLK